MSSAAFDEDGAHIAVIGMACRFPGAQDPEEFWANLVAGVDSITRLPRRPSANGVGGYVPARGFVKEPEWFDADYFGYSPRDARLIDPEHRMFLECAVEALESAGCDPDRHPGVIGVYAGGADTPYPAVLRSRRADLPAVTEWEIRTATGTDFMVTRGAYKLGLRGPAVTVRAACATSLVAVHLAAQGLLAGDCDVALAGGASVRVPTEFGEYAEGGILSPDGVCRTFDAAASGIVGGDGIGLVVLKRLVEARADGDPIRAVIRGSAMNNDGPDRVGYTAPGVAGQAAVVRAAQLIADVEPATVTYVEAHGTATPIGDPIEITALTQAFRAGTERRAFCAIGSVKTNIGHTDAAAGAAGLIKTVMAVERGLIPPSLHFDEPNPQIDFVASPFQVVTRLREWRPENAVRRAGVSSFGMGGTNAHVVVEEPPTPAPPAPARPWQLLVWSARSLAALDEATVRLAAHLREHPELPLDDVAWTLQTGRRELEYRRAAIVNGSADAVEVLSGRDHARLITSTAMARTGHVTFLFPGTTTRLLRAEPAFSRTVEECVAASGRAPAGRVASGLIAFAQEYALAQVCADWGVEPAAVFGSGVGALAAAAVAGVVDMRAAARLVAWRSEPHAERTAFADLIESLDQRPARIPVLAAGRFVDAGETVGPASWAEWLTGSERPDTDVPALLTGTRRVLVELGAGGGLTDLVNSQAAAEYEAISAFSGEAAAVEPAMLAVAARLWLAGIPISWEGLGGGERRVKVPLPTYPFQRRRHLVEPVAAGATQPARDDADREMAGKSPREVVTALFTEMLGLTELDPDDSFFDLGGDSLVATQLLIRARKIFQVELNLRSMLEAPTANEFAALIEQRGARRGSD